VDGSAKDVAINAKNQSQVFEETADFAWNATKALHGRGVV
jgi:hypothetical protein